MADAELDAETQAASMRPCGWPDCTEQFDAYGHIFTGTNIQPGWRQSRVVGYIGPAHRNTIHLPRLDRTDAGVDVVCDCGGWRHKNPPTLGAAAGLWRDHVRAATNRGDR